jgi:hypothetical protein
MPGLEDVEEIFAKEFDHGKGDDEGDDPNHYPRDFVDMDGALADEIDQEPINYKDDPEDEVKQHPQNDIGKGPKENGCGLAKIKRHKPLLFLLLYHKREASQMKNLSLNWRRGLNKNIVVGARHASPLQTKESTMIDPKFQDAKKKWEKEVLAKSLAKDPERSAQFENSSGRNRAGLLS